jgi:DNA-binding MarR family transcriptional regulator
VSRFADAADSPGFLLWHLTLRWQRQITAALAPLELTHVQFVLLACTYWLNHRGESPNQLTVASMAGTDITMTSQVMRKLEGRGLVTRQTDARDTRAKILTVTERGAELAQAAIDVVEAADEEFFSGWPPALAEALRAGPLPADGGAG